MFKDLKVTLYDLFAYLFPGVIGTLALALPVWGLFYRQSWVVIHGYDAALVTAGLGLFYLVGHFIQALGNKLEQLLWPYDRFVQELRTEPLMTVVQRRVERSLSSQAHATTLTHEALLELCEAANAVAGLTTQRDLFEYRKDFYRGLVTSTGVLTAMMLVAAFLAPLQLEMKEGLRVVIPAGLFALGAAFCALATRAWAARYVRFLRYTLREVVVTFAASQFLGTSKKSGSAD